MRPRPSWISVVDRDWEGDHRIHVAAAVSGLIGSDYLCVGPWNAMRTKRK